MPVFLFLWYNYYINLTCLAKLELRSLRLIGKANLKHYGR